MPTTGDSPYVPHDFLRYQPFLIFHKRDNKPANGNTDDMTYLVRQGQEVVVEEDGCRRYPIILVVIPRLSRKNDKKRRPPSLRC